MQADDMDNAYEDNTDEDIDMSIGTNRKQRQLSTATTSCHLTRNQPNRGQSLIAAIETIASALFDYANKRVKERLDLDKCIDSLRDLGLSNLIYFKARNIIEIERNA